MLHARIAMLDMQGSIHLHDYAQKEARKKERTKGIREQLGQCGCMTTRSHQ